MDIKSNPSNGSLSEDNWSKVIRKGKGKVGTPLERQDVPHSTMMQGSTSCNTQQVRVSNSFNELIPFVYEMNKVDQLQDGSGVPLEEDPKEIDGSTEGVTDNAFDISLVRTSSAQQKKKKQR